MGGRTIRRAGDREQPEDFEVVKLFNALGIRTQHKEDKEKPKQKKRWESPEDAARRVRHELEMEQQGTAITLDGNPVRYLTPEDQLHGVSFAHFGYDDVEDDDFRQRPNIRRILRRWSSLGWDYGYTLMYWSDGTDLEALDAKVLAGEATEDDFATALVVTPTTVWCRECKQRFRAFVSDWDEPVTKHSMTERRKLHQRARCHLCQSQIYTLWVIEPFHVPNSPQNDDPVSIDTFGTSVNVGHSNVRYLLPDDSLGELTLHNTDEVEDAYFRERANIRRILRRGSWKHWKHRYALLYWSDGTDLEQLDTKVVAGQATSKDFEGAIALEPETIMCPYCEIEFDALVHRYGEPVFFSFKRRKIKKRLKRHPHQKKCHVCNKWLGDIWVVERFDIPRTGSDSN
jgi:hypothetical protein